MSHDQLPDNQRTEGMPSIHETVKPEPQFQYQANQQKSMQRVEQGRKKRNLLIGAGLGAAGLAVTTGLFIGRTGGSEVPDPGKADKNALAVDGNTAPDKANPEFDKKYGVYQLNADGTLGTAEETYEKLGLENDFTISAEDSVRITQTDEQMEANNDFDAVDVRNAQLNRYMPNLEAIANLINMNNPEARMSRAMSSDLTENESLLLQNNDIAADIAHKAGNATETGTPALGMGFIDQIIAQSPNDASLRAEVCEFSVTGTPASQLCEKAQADAEANGVLFSKYNTYTVPTQDQVDPGMVIQTTIEDGEYPVRFLSGNADVGVVWTNAQGEIVQTNRIEVPTSLTILGSASDAERRIMWGAI